MVQGCLAADPASLTLNFLYQDLFYGAKEEGMAELAMLAMMSDINQALVDNGLDPAQASAIVGPDDVEDDMVFRVNLYRDGVTEPLASLEAPFGWSEDLQAEVDDICDALGTIGIHKVSVATGFGKDGEPEEVSPYNPE
jgi:hypothetical protein